MSTQPPRKKVLFVDDEASIRLTLPRILEEGGFDVRVASSVPEALVEINCARFDVLISDLNIGEEGDGFLVVSAMRHLQPDCVNFILTGYPAFETALQAIHNQVDDYLVKPIDVESLIHAITARLVEPGSTNAVKTLGFLLKSNREGMAALIKKQIDRLSRTQSAGRPSASDVGRLLDLMIQYLESNGPELISAVREQIAQYGKTRAAQGCSVITLTRDFQIVRTLTYDLLEKHLVEMDMHLLVSELSQAEVCWQALLEGALAGLLSSKSA